MKRALIILTILLTCSIAVFAASYKINTSGKVTSPTGTVQNTSELQNLYNNYNAQNYVNQRQVLTNPVGTIDIVMDYSGSMSNWIRAAKRTMSSIVSQLPATTRVGFRVFGQNNGGNNPYEPVLNSVKSIVKSSNGKYKVHTENIVGNTSGSCSATAQIVPVIPYNANTLLNGMNSVNVGGSTPLTYGLQQAVYKDFGGLDQTNRKKIVLITDGGENCGGDPCAFARQLMSQRRDITIDVVLVSSASSGLRCLADFTGGKVYNANDVSGFARALTDSMKDAAPQNSEPVQNYEFIGE